MIKSILTVALAGTALATSVALAYPGDKSKEAVKSVEGMKDKAVKAMDVVDTAIASKDHTTLVAAVKAAALVEALKGPGPFTVFAPTNAAFDKLPKETLASLLKPENKAQLAGILTYHVVKGNVMAADAIKLDGKEVETLNGAKFMIKVTDGKVTIGNDPKAMATVTTADLKASNGVIHVIDTVILPPAKPATETKPAAK
jgi:uncharacterized surface protein with fasciclin (FAS1) repeats